MKVICIDTPGGTVPGPIEGDIDEVLIETKAANGMLIYLLVRFGRDIGYNQKCFIPLSDIDETIREEKVQECDARDDH